MNPVVLSLLSIFGGVLITAAAGLIGAAIARRGEHHKWLRERRYEAAVDFLKVIGDMPKLEAGGVSVRVRPTFDKELSDAGAALTLLGPDHLVTRARLLITAATNDSLKPRPSTDDSGPLTDDIASIVGDRADFIGARLNFIEAARDALRIPDPKG